MVVVALGNRLDGRWVHPTLRDRMDEAIRLLREHEDAYLVCTGAQTNPDVPLAESEAMRDYALLQGVDRERVLLEGAARDTIGNAYFTRRLLDDLRKSGEGDALSDGRDDGRSVDGRSVDGRSVDGRSVDGRSVGDHALRVVTSGVHTVRALYTFERCFGDEWSVSVHHDGATEWTVESLPPHERSRLERAREFFSTVPRGNVDAIGRKMLAEHDLYSWADADALVGGLAVGGGRPDPG
jgi:hypothetical protein